MSRHQFIERSSGGVLTERLFADRIVRFLYSRSREQPGVLLRALASRRMSSLLGTLNFDLPLAPTLVGQRRFLASCGVDLAECVEPAGRLDTPRRIFERRIRFWDCRPLPADPATVVSPADSRLVCGDFRSEVGVFVKGRLFDLPELLGPGAPRWEPAFRDGAFALFRLTPEQYHHNHVPVSGTVVDFYEVAGHYHSCNPSALLEGATLLAKNRRAVTVIDTDRPGGTGVGRVAMVEVAALMIGEVVQRYSRRRYDAAEPMRPGLQVERGAVKSLFRPGSSSVVLLFEPGRLELAEDLRRNQSRRDVVSRYSAAFGGALVETEVRVRQGIGRAVVGGARTGS